MKTESFEDVGDVKLLSSDEQLQWCVRVRVRMRVRVCVRELNVRRELGRT